MPRSCANSITLLLVIPSRADVSSGVTIFPSVTINIFSPLPSATKPFVSKSSASS